MVSGKKLLVVAALLFVLLGFTELRDLYMYYSTHGDCKVYRLTYDYSYIVNRSEEHDGVASVVLSLGADGVNLANCSDGFFCSLLDSAFKEFYRVEPNTLSGYRYSDGPSLTLYRYDNGSLAVAFLQSVNGTRIPVEYTARAGMCVPRGCVTSFFMRLRDVEAPFSCFELNKRFYAFMVIFKGAASAFIAFAVLFAYEVYRERRGGVWGRWS